MEFILPNSEWIPTFLLGKNGLEYTDEYKCFWKAIEIKVTATTCCWLNWIQQQQFSKPNYS